MSTRPRLPLAFALLAMVPSLNPLGAQSELALEVGASQIGPPLGVDAEQARFVIGGLRGSHYALGGSGVFASVLFGKTANDAAGGSFLSGVLEGSLASPWTDWVTGSLDVRFLGYGVQKPFPYRAFAVEGGPALRIAGPSASLHLRALGGYGRSQLELWLIDGGASRVFEEDLWRAGGSAELLIGPVTSRAGIIAGMHRTPEGNFRDLGARMMMAGRWGAAELRFDRWNTPTGSEMTGGLSLIIPIGNAWNLRGFFGRTDPDPLTLAQPGSASGGFLLGRSLLSSSDDVFADEAPYEIIEYGETRSRVRITVEPPVGATTVQLLGDFTLWDPVAMAREGNRWVLEIDVEPGTHHFGFLVDDEWFVPADAPDVVPDEWGRLSATLVIEGA